MNLLDSFQFGTLSNNESRTIYILLLHNLLKRDKVVELRRVSSLLPESL